MLSVVILVALLPAVRPQCAAGTGAVSLDVTTTCTKVVLSGFTKDTDEGINGVYELQPLWDSCTQGSGDDDFSTCVDAATKQLYCPDDDDDGTFDNNWDGSEVKCSGDLKAEMDSQEYDFPSYWYRKSDYILFRNSVDHSGANSTGSIWSACKDMGTDDKTMFMHPSDGLTQDDGYRYPKAAGDSCKAFGIQWNAVDLWTFPKTSSGFWYSTQGLEAISDLKDIGLQPTEENYAQEQGATSMCIATASTTPSCTACEKGKYSSATDEVCKPCPVGTYNDATSATSADACKPCPENFFSPRGSSSCTKATAHAEVKADSSGEVCSAGYKRVCSDQSGSASVSGALMANGVYTKLSSTIDGKPAFSMIPDAGQIRAQFQIRYSSQFKRWEQYSVEDGSVYNFVKGSSSFPSSGKWSTESPTGTIIAIDNFVVDCDKFTCSACPQNTFWQLPTDIECMQCPATFWTDGDIAQVGRSSCRCEPGYVGGDCDAQVAGREVAGVPDVSYNGLYKYVGQKNGKNHFNNGLIDLYWEGVDHTGNASANCTGRWYMGDIAVGTSISNALERRKALYTIMSPCTNDDEPPNSNGILNWHFIGVKKVRLVPLKLVTVQCPQLTCSLCPGGKFADPDQLMCLSCVRDGICNAGLLFIPNDHWIAPPCNDWNNETYGTCTTLKEVDNTTKVYKCLHPGACIGNLSTYETVTCREGHEGRLCGICSFGYYMADGVCTACPGGNNSVGQYGGHAGAFAGVCVAFLLFAAFKANVLANNLSMDTEHTEDDVKGEGETQDAESMAADMKATQKKGGGSKAGSGSCKNAFSGLREKLKILVSYMQVASMFISKLSVPWPPYVKSLVGAFSFISVDFVSLTNLNCAVESTYFETFQIMMAVPIFMMLMAVLATCLGLCMFRGKPGKGIWLGYSLKIFSLVLFAVYPTLSKYILQLFKCTDIEGTRYLDADLRLKCEGEQYEFMSMLGLVFFILYPFGIPFIFAIALYRSRPTLQAAIEESENQDEQDSNKKIDLSSPLNAVSVLSLGWLSMAYEPAFWFWEMMEFFRKLVLSGVLVFVQPGTSAQILVATMVSVMFLGFVSYYKPYADDGDDTVGFISFICLVYTLVLGLSLRVAETEDLDEYQRLIYSFALLLVNVALFILILWIIYDNINEQASKKSKKLKGICALCKKKEAEADDEAADEADDINRIHPEHGRHVYSGDSDSSLDSDDDTEVSGRGSSGLMTRASPSVPRPGRGRGRGRQV